MGKRELVALLNLSSWCIVMVERLFLAVPWGCLRFVIVVFPDHTHLLFLKRFQINIPVIYNKPQFLTSIIIKRNDYGNLKSLSKLGPRSILFQKL